MKSMTLTQIGEFYNTAHLVRPIQPRVVNEYANLMKKDAEFPPIQLGVYTGQDGQQAKLIVDGAHVYRAAVLAKMEKFGVEITEYESLADALAAQLKANIAHGLRITPMQRDIRIRQLNEVYNWPVRRIASAVGLHFSSVSRILRGGQNKTGTGKGGGKPGRQAPVVAHALPPRIFFKTMQNLHLTLSSPQSRTLILAAIHDPKRSAEIPRTIALLTQVAQEANLLLKLATETGVSTELSEAQG